LIGSSSSVSFSDIGVYNIGALVCDTSGVAIDMALVNAFNSNKRKVVSKNIMRVHKKPSNFTNDKCLYYGNRKLFVVLPPRCVKRCLSKQNH
jgi:hypothetical protein